MTAVSFVTERISTVHPVPPCSVQDSHGFLGGLLSASLTFLYGAAVASLYTFHSYRSGLATALHAAGVADPLIQLICRWMCPESLHVYRRIGTREHEGSIRRASAVDVDVIQSVNAPKVTADAGFGELVAQLQGTRGASAQKDFEIARNQVLHTAAQRAPVPTDLPGPRRPMPITAHTHAPPPVRPPAQPAGAAQPRGPFGRQPPAGTQAFVAKEHWPDAPCLEHGGARWTVIVQSATRHTAVITFPHTTAPSGAPYAPIRVQLHVLRRLD